MLESYERHGEGSRLAWRKEVEIDIAVAFCAFFWTLKFYIAARYRTRQRTRTGRRGAWRWDTPDWVTRAAAWIDLLSWAALGALIGLAAYSVRQHFPPMGVYH